MDTHFIPMEARSISEWVDGFHFEFQPLVLATLQEYAGNYLLAQVEGIESLALSRQLAHCGQQKIQLARRLQALFDLNGGLQQELIPELEGLYQQRQQQTTAVVLAQLLAESSGQVESLQVHAAAETCEQARQALLSAAVLLENNINNLQALSESLVSLQLV